MLYLVELLLCSLLYDEPLIVQLKRWQSHIHFLQKMLIIWMVQNHSLLQPWLSLIVLTVTFSRLSNAKSSMSLFWALYGVRTAILGSFLLLLLAILNAKMISACNHTILVTIVTQYIQITILSASILLHFDSWWALWWLLAPSSLPTMSQNTTGHCGPLGQKFLSEQKCRKTDECALSIPP